MTFTTPPIALAPSRWRQYLTLTKPRVVSLIASATEIVHALGAGDLQVARSHECDFPERVLEKAVERMLPKESPLARKQLTHLLIYNNGEHPHQAQSPEVVDFAARNSKNTRSL